MLSEHDWLRRRRISRGNSNSSQMPRVVDTKHPHKAIVAQIEARDATVGSCDPNGFEVGGVERAHQVKNQNADGSSMSKERNAPTLVLFNRFVKLS